MIDHLLNGVLPIFSIGARGFFLGKRQVFSLYFNLKCKGENFYELDSGYLLFKYRDIPASIPSSQI